MILKTQLLRQTIRKLRARDIVQWGSTCFEVGGPALDFQNTHT